MSLARRPACSVSRAILLLAGPGLAACGPSTEQTGLIAEVSTDLRVPAELDEVRVIVNAPEGGELYRQTFPLGEGSAHYRLPMRVGFFPEGQAIDHAVRIEAQGWLGSTLAVSRSATLGFLRGKVVLVPLPLLAVCAGKLCALAEETCVETGRCQSNTVDPNQLPRYHPAMDGGGATDAGGGRDEGAVPDGGGADEGVVPDGGGRDQSGGLDLGGRDEGGGVDMRIDVAIETRVDVPVDLPGESRADVPGTDGGLNSGLVGYWTFDQAGTTYPDRSGNGNDARVNPASPSPPTWLATLGTRSGVVRIEAVQSWLEVPASSSLNTVASAFTMGAWVYLEPHAMMFEQAIVMRQIGQQSAYGLAVASSGGFETVVETPITAPGALPKQTWVHVAATYDGQLVRLYVNGIMVGPAYAVSGPPLGPTTKALILGARNDDFAGIYQVLADSKIDDVVIYSRALSAAEVNALATGSGPLAR